jgi:hypothetical protein
MDYGPFWRMTVENTLEITPLKPNQLLLAQFGYQQFNVEFNTIVSKEALTDPRTWAHVVGKLKMNDEIRVVCASATMLARLMVTFANGFDVRLRVLSYEVFEEEDISDDNDEYFIKQRGQQKWCLMKRGNPVPILKDMPEKAIAEQQKSQYLRTMRS